MNSIYIGDRELDPPEDDECETCRGVNPFDCMDCCYDPDPGEPNDYPETDL